MSVGIARSLLDPIGAPSFMGTTSGVSTGGGGDDGDDSFSGATGLAMPFKRDAGAVPLPPTPPLLANLNRKPGLGVWVSGLMVSRLADEAAIFVNLVIVADEAELEAVRRFDQQLRAAIPAVTLACF